MVDDVFRALADPSRRALLERLDDRGGQTLRELCAGLNIARQSVSKHLLTDLKKALEEPAAAKPAPPTVATASRIGRGWRPNRVPKWLFTSTK